MNNPYSHVIIAEGEGADIEFVPKGADLKQALHDFMCYCKRRHWETCLNEDVKKDIGQLDEVDNCWVMGENGQPFFIRWFEETGRVTVYRVPERSRAMTVKPRSEPIHVFTWTNKDEGDCGAHGCNGHTTFIVTCSCGWVKEFKGTYSGRPDEPQLMTNHRLDYMEQQLGVRHEKPNLTTDVRTSTRG